MNNQLLKYVKVMGSNWKKHNSATLYLLWDRGKDYEGQYGTERKAISFLTQVNINLLSKWTLREISGKVIFII